MVKVLLSYVEEALLTQRIEAIISTNFGLNMPYVISDFFRGGFAIFAFFPFGANGGWSGPQEQ